MIYAEWFFCYQARLGADEAVKYLEILYALKEDKLPIAEKIDAIKKLGVLEPLLQGYAIPILVQILFSYREKAADRERGDNEKNDYVYNIKETLKNIIGEKKALSRLIEALDGGKVVALVNGFVRQHSQGKEEIKARDYLQTDTVMEEVFILSVLKGVARTLPDQISPIVRGEEQAPFIKLALNGSFGQLAWNLAVEILGLCNEPIFNLMELFPEDWSTRPDLMEIVVHIRYRGNMDQLMSESCKFVFFKNYFRMGASYYQNFWVEKSIGKDEFIRSCAAMWQGVLWSCAMESDAEKIMGQLAELWDVSDNKGAVRDFLHPNYIQKCFIPHQSNAYAWKEVVQLVACPWVEANKAGKNETNFGRYGRLRQNSTALRIFIAIPIMQSILLRLGRDDAALGQISLLLHWGKLFLTRGARYISRRTEEVYAFNSRAPWTSSVCLLGAYANRVVEQIGMGKINSLVPDWIMDELVPADEEHPKTCERVRNLYETDAFQAAAHWAALSLAEGGNGEDNPWFRGGNSSCAASLCQVIFTEKPQIQNDRDTLLLAYQAYPNYIPAGPNQWVKSYSEDKKYMVQVSSLLCEQKPELEEWNNLKELELGRFRQDAGKLALTMRLFAAYSSIEVDRDNVWLREWTDCFSSIQQNSEFSGLSRYELMSMFRLRPQYSISWDSLRDVLRLIIQIVDEFTDCDTAYYQLLLVRMLREENPVLGENTYDGFCIQLIEDLYNGLYQNRGQVWDAQIKRKNKLLLSFIMDNEERFYNVENKSQFETFWKDKILGRQQTRMEELHSMDAVQVLTCRMWERGDRGIVAIKGSTDISKAKYGKRVEVLNLFAMKGEIREECWYVSVIVGRDNGNGFVTFVINYGGEETAVYKTTDKKLWRYGIGDVILVSFHSGKVEAIMQEAFEKKDGDWALGEYTLNTCNVTVQVLGENEWKNPTAEMLNRWCPDLSLLFSNNPIKGKCLVEREGNKWMPITRDFSQLIIEQILRRDNPERVISLVLVKRATQCGREIWIFSSGIGFNYGVFRENLDKKCLAELQNWVGGPEKGTDKGAGLILHMKLDRKADGIPMLSLYGDRPVDDKNIRWKNQFAEDEQFVVYKDENGGWYMNSKVPEIADKIKVSFNKILKNCKDESKLNVQLSKDWDAKCQRCGEIEVKLVSSKSLKGWLGVEDVIEILDLEPGKYLTLDYVDCEKVIRGYHYASLENNVAVRCAAESFSPYNIKKSDAEPLYEKRKCIVEYIDKKGKRAENENLIPYYVKELEECGRSMRGIVTEIPKGLSPNLEITVCLVDGQRILYVKAPVSAFSPVPFNIGEPVAAERNGENWVFRVQPRIIYVRALWELENHKPDMERVPYGMPLGIADINGMGMGLMTCAGTPTLHFYRPEMESDCVEGETAKIPERLRGRGNRVAYRRCSTALFEDTFLTSIISICDEESEFIGEASSSIDMDDVMEWQVRHEMHKFVSDDNKVYYDLRRVFVPVDADIQAESGEHGEQKEEQIKSYCQWKARDDFHTTGGMRKTEDGYYILLHNLIVPMDVNKAGEEDDWQNRIRMVKGEYPSRGERGYDPNDVRVKLHIEDSAWVASFRETDFMRLDKEFEEYCGSFPGSAVEKKLYFDGLDEEDRMKFEWGYGYKLLVRQEDVTDMDGNMLCRELFFGDWIAMFTLEETDGEFGWKMRVQPEHIHHNLEYSIMGDSKEDAVQLLMVQKDVERQQVIVKKVSVLEKGAEQGGWSLTDNFNAVLDEESIVKILEEKTEEDIVYILARPNLDEFENKKRPMQYTYIPLDRQSEQDHILEGKVVCLVAGEISNSNSMVGDNFTNDCKINFYLYNELPEKEDGDGWKSGKGQKNRARRRRIHMKVAVTRRKFSLDESRLRILKNENPFYGCNMLVRLEKRNEFDAITWSGNVTTTPSRSKKSLIEWVSKQQSCLVTLGKIQSDSQIQVELSPGILSTITYSSAERLVPGALASLKVDQERLVAEMILPGDASYIPVCGRAAELLIMDGSLKHFKQNISTGDGNIDKAYPQKNDFTVAGFPQIKLKDFAFLKQVITKEPPRLAWIKKAQGTKLYVDKRINVSPAYLKIDEKTQTPILEEQLPEGTRSTETQWNYVSFKDGTISEIIEHVRRGKWHYHDKRTGIWDEDSEQMRQADWPIGDSRGEIPFDRIPLFLTRNNRLRYEAKDMMQWGYSAREIYQNGLPQQQGWYPVAAADEERLWLEVLPGKILDIPKKYLFIENKGQNTIARSLESMGTAFFNTGDEVRLSETRRSSMQSAKLLLEDVRYGIRYSFLEGNAYLPVSEVKEGGVVLGGGLFSITIPVANIGEWTEEKMGWLSGDNTLLCCSEMPKFPRHFTVMLGINSRHRLEIKGMPGIKVLPAYDYMWKDAVWLRSYLWNWDNAANNLFADGIPMVVSDVTKADGGPVYRVYYPQPDLREVPTGTEICCNMIGMFIDKDAGRRIVLRAGGYMICIKGTELLPGLPEIDQEYVCRVLADKKITFWMHKAEEGWFPGLDKKGEDIRQVELLACIPQADGIICRDKVLYQLWWLPKEQAARAGNVSVEDIFAALGYDKECQLHSCRVMENGTVSLIHTTDSQTKYTMLEMDSKIKMHRVIPYIKIKQQPANAYAYLGELSPCGDIIYLLSERELTIQNQESIPVNIVKKTEQLIEAIPEGMQRNSLNISPWIAEALRKSYLDKKISYEAFAGMKPERYKLYNYAIEKALRDAYAGVCEPPEENAEVKLVYLYYLKDNLERQNKKSAIVFGEVRKALAIWIRGTGLSLATGFDENYSWVAVKELELLPSLAAILLLNKITKTDEEKCKQLAVHLTRVLGMVCNNSMHQEYLLTRWLFKKEKKEMWTRLSRLSFGGETVERESKAFYDGTLTNDQYKRIVQTCESFKNRRNCPKELRMVSECILFAVGAREDYSFLYENLSRDKDLHCSILARFGRCLLPGTGLLTVGRELSEDTKKELEKVLGKMLQRESVPVTLITDNIFPLRDEEKKWAANLCKSILYSR